MDNWEEICLAAIGDDEELRKQIDQALKEVVKNIADPNKDSGAKRTVTAKIEFIPAANRQSAKIDFSVNSKLAGDVPGCDHVVIALDGIGSIPMAEQLTLDGHISATKGGEA